MPGENLDLSSNGPTRPQPVGERKRFIGVHFACCEVYQRIYINHERTAYVGHCPRCARRVRFEIGPGGTDARMFTSS